MQVIAMFGYGILSNDAHFSYPQKLNLTNKPYVPHSNLGLVFGACPGGALGYFLGGYVPPGTPNCHPVLKKISPKIDTPF